MHAEELRAGLVLWPEPSNVTCVHGLGGFVKADASSSFRISNGPLSGYSRRVPIYKYLSQESFALDFIHKGRMKFDTLAYFRAYEDEQVRGDPDDGKLVAAPAAGLQINRESGPEIWPGWRFEASVKAEDLFVFCLSRERSEKLAVEFNSPFCVEVINPISLVSRVSASVKLRSKFHRERVYHQVIDYRPPDAPPKGDWALTEKLAFIKPTSFQRQDEYRIVIGKKGAFEVYNGEYRLTTGPGERPPPAQSSPLFLTVGSLKRVTQLHRF